jgi:Ca2+-binding RTX toxin-like protein
VTLLAAGLVPLLPTQARAAVTCTRDGATDRLQINLADNDYVYLSRDADNIKVQTLSGMNLITVTCTGGTPTVNNTDRVNIDGSAGANYLFVILSSGRFQPGASNEPGPSDEIEFHVDLGLGGSSNQMFITGAPVGQSSIIRAGTEGINLNAFEDQGRDADMDIVPGAYLQVNGSSVLPNVISGAGGLGTGDPYPQTLDLRGWDVPEVLTGGTAGDYIDAGDGKDLVSGGEGEDTLVGGDQKDTLSYKGPTDVAVYLEGGTATDGNGNIESVTDFENIVGSSRQDDLTGSTGRNRINGGGGGDLLFGLGEDDRLLGKKGNDELYGEEGDDTLNGGRGRSDICVGGPGADERRNCEGP